jgi:hypothetical protein
MAEYVHFTIGEGAGKLLMEIAQEHLLDRLNPEKALETITGSLTGIPNSLALNVLVGDYVILVDVEDQMFEVEQRDPVKHEDYPFIDVKEWYKKTHKQIGDDGRDLYSGLGRALKYNSTNYGSFKMEFDFANIIKFINGNSDPLIHELESDHNLQDLKGAITTIKKFIEKADKSYKIMDWFEAMYPEKFEPTNNPLDYISRGRHNVIDLLGIRLQKLLGRGIQEILKEMDEEDKEVKSYIDNAIAITKVLKKDTFDPVDILQNYTAGWLSPEGDYYALNGEIANMLHLNIADKLQEMGIIPEDCLTKDSWLEENGWVKIHKDWILYGGWFNDKLDKPNVPMTEIQRKKIYEYGQLCHRGLLKFGFRMERISAARFQMTEDLMLKKLFDF